jgi:thioredoxin reductase (NADPH)
VALDAKGFVLTGAEAGTGRRSLETSRRGVFAIGDVRAASIKRVAAAVGEGAQVVATLHDFLVATGRRNDVTWPFARMAREPGAGLATSLQPVHDAPSA